MTVLAGTGWGLAAALAIAVVVLRRRLALVAEAAHELRGPAVALWFAVAALRRDGGGVRWAVRLESELERMRAGLADLDAARAGRRAVARPAEVALEPLVNAAADGWRASVVGAGRGVAVRWQAGPVRVRADRRRLAQALGNLLANAAEHGSGAIEVRARRAGRGSVRVEVRDGGPARPAGRRRGRPPGRGHGLRIAARAIREAGGRLELEHGRAGTVAAIELPVVDRRGDGAAGARTAVAEPAAARARRGRAA